MAGLPPQLEIVTTGDGSPTILYKRADGYLEKMHHSGGAFSESLYIYHHGLKTALSAGCPPRVASVGLGLGYNELIALAEFFTQKTTDFTIWSFEIDTYLREQFKNWVEASAYSAEGIQSCFAEIAKLVCANFKISPEQFREFVASALKDKKLILRGPFPIEAADIQNVGIIFYDAFSNKMSPELWQEEELRQSLSAILAPQSVLTTYAATGALNRVLKSLGFRLLDRAGFQGKRESTLAIRP